MICLITKKTIWLGYLVITSPIRTQVHKVFVIVLDFKIKTYDFVHFDKKREWLK